MTRGVEKERGVKYGSIISKEVPAAGIVITAVTIPTAVHRDERSSVRHSDNRRQPDNRRKIQSRYHSSSIVRSSIWVSFTDPAISSSKQVSFACDMKNSEPNGYSVGFRSFLIAGR